jgi:Homeodomain
MTPNMTNVAPPAFAGIGSYHHSIMRLPHHAQLSPNNSVTQFYSQQKISKTGVNDSKAQQSSSGNGSNVKRKRSWSRAVFSNLQRKGLERQFEFQKYITKPDRKKLAARLGLKDAQVKVWFQVSFASSCCPLRRCKTFLFSSQSESPNEMATHDARYDNTDQSRELE